MKTDNTALHGNKFEVEQPTDLLYDLAEISECLDTRIKELQLGKCDENIINDAISFIEGLKVDFIAQKRVLVARLFEQILRQTQKVYYSFTNDVFDISKIPVALCEKIIIVFGNIEGILNEATDIEKDDGSVAIVSFLSFLKSRNRLSDNTGDDSFAVVKKYVESLSDLDDIRFIFEVEKNGIVYFPLEEMLADVIKDQFTSSLREIQEYHIRIFKFAVRMFQKGSDNKRALDELVEKCNLHFVNYLRPDNSIIDTESLLNYRKNGVMIFISDVDKKILIRSNRADYFSEAILKENNLNLQYEKSYDGVSKIGWFVEYSYSNYEILSFDELIKDISQRKNLLYLYFSGYQNIFLDNAIYRKNGELHPINHFMKSDKYVIRNYKNDVSDIESIKSGNKSTRNRKRVNKERALNGENYKEVFREYYNIPYKISVNNTFNRLFIGTFISLMEIYERNSLELLSMDYTEDEFYQNQLIFGWIGNNANKRDNMNKMLEKVYEELKYCNYPKNKNQPRGVQTIENHDITLQAFFPYKFDYKLLLKLLIDDDYVGGHSLEDDNHDTNLALSDSADEGGEEKQRTANIDVISCTLRIDDEKYLEYRDKNVFQRVELVEIEDEQGVIDGMYSGQECFLLKMDGVYRTDEQTILKKIYHLKDVWAHCLDIQTTQKFGKESYCKIIKLISLHEDGLSSKVGNYFGTFENQAFFRLVHNMLWCSVNITNVDNYKRIFRGHQALDFSDIKNDETFKMTDQYALYVPKNGNTAGSTLESIYNKYIKPLDKRDIADFYCNEIGFNKASGKYCRRNQDIKTLFFLTDNFENGTQTTNVLAAYLGIKTMTDKHINEELVRIQHYWCKGKGISLRDVIKTNKCKIQVHGYYGTEEGKQKIKCFLNDAGYKGTSVTYEKEITEKTETIKDSVEMFFPEIKEHGKYAVIREFNLTKNNVFPKPMISDGKKAITLFLLKKENPNRSTSSFIQDDEYLKRVDNAIDVIEGVSRVPEKEIQKLNRETVRERLETLERRELRSFEKSSVGNFESGKTEGKDNERTGNMYEDEKVSDASDQINRDHDIIHAFASTFSENSKAYYEETMNAQEQFGIMALQKYFLQHGVSDGNISSASALTVVSVLPPRMRIALWEGVLPQIHNTIVLEKLTKAYAKNGQLDRVKEKLQEWINLEYIDKRFAKLLYEGAELLYTNRDRFPIADNLQQARKNFAEVQKITSAPSAFLEIMRLILE